MEVRNDQGCYMEIVGDLNGLKMVMGLTSLIASDGWWSGWIGTCIWGMRSREGNVHSHCAPYYPYHQQNRTLIGDLLWPPVFENQPVSCSDKLRRCEKCMHVQRTVTPGVRLAAAGLASPLLI